MKQDNAVEHPQHYGGADDPFEAIKVVEAWSLNFALGSAVKYICRHGRKAGEDAVSDLRKAAWYCAREADRLERERARLPSNGEDVNVGSTNDHPTLKL